MPPIFGQDPMLGATLGATHARGSAPAGTRPGPSRDHDAGTGCGQPQPDSAERVRSVMELVVPIVLLLVMAASLGVMVVVSARILARRAGGRRRK